MKVCRVFDPYRAVLPLLLASVSVASAQTALPEPQGAEEIMVTARKRSESLFDVPASVTAFGAEALSRAGVKSLADLQNAIPNLQYTQRGDLANQITIRGVGGDPRNVGLESGVGVYVDQVFAGRTGAYNLDLANVSQIEVLRGPQGTVFGKNTTGGVLNITTRKPGPDFMGEMSASYGNYDALYLKGSVSGQVAQDLYAGVTFASTSNNGYLNNLYPGSPDLQDIDRRGGRLQLRWTPSSNLEVNLTADRTTNRSQTALSQPSNPPIGPDIPFKMSDPRFDVSMEQSNKVNLDTTGFSGVVDYTMPNDLTLTSVTGYRKTNVLVFSDADGLPIDILHSGPFTDDSKMFTQELRVTSPKGSKLNYVAGLYYFGQRATSYREVYAAGSLANGYVTNALVDTDAYAAFANGDYAISDNLTATAGLRYTTEKKSGSYSQIGVGGRSYNFNNLSRQDYDLSWTASLNYHFSKTLTAYVTASKGFKSGGFNVDPITVTGMTPSGINFAPEKVINYEAGIKARALDGKLSFTAAGFYENYDDKQVAQYNSVTPGSVPTVIISNAGTARIYGLEGEATYAPDAFWTFAASGSWLNTKYTSFPNAATANGVFVSYTGNKLENAPEWSANFSVERRQPFYNGFIDASANLRFTGDTYFQADNSPLHLQKSYALLDARLAYEMQDGNLTVALWGKNLTQEDYYVFSRISLGIHQVLYGDPRTYGITVTKKF